MNWTAWNSVWANALTKRPNDIPRIAFATASSTISSSAWPVSSPRRPNPTMRDDDGLHDRDDGEGDPVAEQQLDLRQRRRQQPLERPRRPLAQHRDRGDEEHADQRKEPEHRDPDALEHLLPPGKELVDEDRSAHTARRAGAQACAGRAGAGRARGRPWRRFSARSGAVLLDQAQEGSVEVGMHPSGAGARSGADRR